jgi:hypothetical protein
MMASGQSLKHAVDAGATAGAMDLLLGRTPAQAEATAVSYIRQRNRASDAEITINIPPTTGPYAGRSQFIEAISSHPFHTRFMHILGAAANQSVGVRSVAGYGDATAGAALVVLDPSPPAIAIPGISLTLPSFPALIGGLEVVGVGAVRVDGAVLVNTAWGGVDENGNSAGDGPGPPYGISCTPLLSLTRLQARDIRVAGGVDDPANYGSFDDGEASPLRANRLPVPDPYQSLPVPTSAADPDNVNTTLRGGVQVVSLPLIPSPTVLQPGIYEWIDVVSGQVIFEPGIYIIRSVNPVSGLALSMTGGTVTAHGVMFYITSSAGYDAASGSPDDADGDEAPAVTPTGAVIPSAVINVALSGSISGLNDPGSPFDGMIVYQRRRDYRPIVIAHQDALLGGALAGRIYAKWGHVVLLGNSTHDVSIVAGSARLVAVGEMTLAPSVRLPPAQDVFLVE